MSEKFKYIACAAAVAFAAAVGAIIFSIWYSRSASDLLAYLPAPREGAPYILLETKAEAYPAALSSLLTDGIYAHLKSDTPRGALLAAAGASHESVLLIEENADGMTMPNVLCAARFSAADAELLKAGALPASFVAKFGMGEAAAEDGVFALRAENLSAPLYYAVDGDNFLFAPELPAVHRMLLCGRDGSGLVGKKWTQQPEWPAHIEISDGGVLTSEASTKSPITIEAAWGAPYSETASEARWAFVDVGVAARAYLSVTLSKEKWSASQLAMPQPLLLAAGFTLPEFKGAPDSLRRPHRFAAKYGEMAGLSEEETNEIIAGRTIFSLGGQNKILWLSLPGVLAHFSGRPELMRKLVDGFWGNILFGAEPEPIEGFEYGGAATLPFSVVGAGGEGAAAIGLISEQSLGADEALSQLLADGTEAIAWLYADLPKIGMTIAEMTNLSSFFNYGRSSDFSSAYDNSPLSWNADDPDPEPFQPEFSISPFDQDIADAFGKALEPLGRVMIIWETPMSGRVSWYNH